MVDQPRKSILHYIFEYPVSCGKSGYGMISEYDPQNNGFIHKEMWVQSPNDLPE